MNKDSIDNLFASGQLKPWQIIYHKQTDLSEPQTTFWIRIQSTNEINIILEFLYDWSHT